MDEYRECRRCGTTFKVGFFQVFPDLCGRCKDEKFHQKQMETLAEREPGEWVSLADHGREIKEDLDRARAVYRSALADIGVVMPEKLKPKEPESKLWDGNKQESNESNGCFLNILAILFALIAPAFLVHFYTPSEWDRGTNILAYLLFLIGSVIVAVIGRIVVGLIVKA